ncbi:hypothetical protein [Marinimicrobium sp. C2-29]|uniref:hypothetical protein n=1 Tax=Marinimicrobium sp. C2-29 TaxID=3139825 RepID=UPI0031390FCF
MQATIRKALRRVILALLPDCWLRALTRLIGLSAPPQADVAIGNTLGSNIINPLGVLGVSALLQPLPISDRTLKFDQWVILGASLVL